MSLIPLQTACLKFTVRYVGYSYGLATSVFARHDELKASESSLEDNTDYEELALSQQELLVKAEERLRNARLLCVPGQFAIMLCDTPISIFFKSPQGHEGFFSSSKIFSRDKNIRLLIKAQFASIGTKELYVEEGDFDKAYHRFFRAAGDLSPERQAFVSASCREGRFLACFDLFNHDAKGAFELLTQYSKEEDYEEDGVVSVLLQKTYGITATEANRNFLRMLKVVRTYLSSNDDTDR